MSEQQEKQGLFNWAWRGNAIGEYMPTLTLIGVFSISILMVVSREVNARLSEVNDCLENAGDCGEFCPQDANFDGLPAGTILSDQFAGLTITGQGNNVGGSPMVFDSGNPSGGDTDIGTPHEAFGGPGKGIGGGPGQPGENNRPMGNVIILSEDNDASDPDDDGNGGWITFEFDYPAHVSYAWFVDVDSDDDAADVTLYDPEGNVIFSGSPYAPPKNSDVTVYNLDGTVKTTKYNVNHPGDNSVQRLDIDMSNVARMEFSFSGSGSIDSVFFCE